MRFEDLALRLHALEKKVAMLSGLDASATVDQQPPIFLEKLEARLSTVETLVDHLVAVKTQEHIDAIIAAPADAAPVAVEDVIALSPSADHEEAAAIVADVVTEQHEAEPVEHTEVADIVSAAIVAVVTAEPEVVVDAVAITAAIVDAVADMPAPAPEVTTEAAQAVVDVIATATGVAEVAPEVAQQVIEAITTPADPELDAVEARLDAAEAKVDGLLGN